MLLLEETLILLRVQRYKFSIYKKGVCTYGRWWRVDGGWCWILCFFYIYKPAKVPYFFISPEKFLFAHLWGISNEWMKKLFFPFFFRPKNRMNEWPLNFSVEKKKNKTTHKNAEKKHKQLLYKKRNFIKIWLNDRWTFPREMKKKNILFFLPASREHRFLIWMN